VGDRLGQDAIPEVRREALLGGHIDGDAERASSTKGFLIESCREAGFEPHVV
jgi:hypothetical protein